MDDDAHLPIFKGRVVSYIVTADGSNISDGSTSQVTEVSGMAGGLVNGRAGVNNHAFNGRNHHLHHQQPNHGHNFNHSRRGYGTAPFPSARIGHIRPADDFDDSTTTCTETESAISSRCSRRGRAYGGRCGRDCDCTDSSSIVTSDMDSTSFIDSDDEDDDDDEDIDESASRISTTTADTSVSRIHESRLRRHRRMKRRMPIMSNASSVSSTMTDSTMSMNVITVNLNLEPPDSFLGISLVGERGGGIYVRSIIDGGAVAADGRIETGDKILQVNDMSLDRMSNDDAVELLREAAQRHEAIKLVVLKTWEVDKPPRFAIPRSEPVRPIDPGAWVAHTEAARAAGEYPIRPPSSATLASNSSSIVSSVTDSERLLTMDKQVLNLDTVDMLTITKSMAAYDSGLDIKERDWLKIKIPDAFLGSDVVDWLYSHVQGFNERRDAKKYASQMMKQGFIRHTLNKNSFSEQCYYVFGDMINLADAVNRLRLVDDEECDSSDRDTLITVRDGRGTGGSNSGSPWHQQHHQVAPASYTEPQQGHGFLPWSTDAVHYGTIFGPNAGSGDVMRSMQQQPNSRSGGSSNSDADRSQMSGPLPISSFKPQVPGQQLLSSFTPNHLNNVMHHHYQNEMQQNQYSEPNYATAVLSNDGSKCSSRSNGIRNGEEIAN